MAKANTISRRDFIGAVTALGSIGLAACSTSSQQSSRLWAADRASGRLPPRGEFVVRNADIVSMDPKLGDIPNGDVHVRDGALVAIDTEEVIAKAAASFHAARKRAGGPY